MQPSFLRGMRQDIHKKEYKKRNRINSFFKRAGDGNRTHVSSLEGWCSTIELHPHIAVPASRLYPLASTILSISYNS